MDVYEALYQTCREQEYAEIAAGTLGKTIHGEDSDRAEAGMPRFAGQRPLFVPGLPVL
jgi:hypothetical protein